MKIIKLLLASLFITCNVCSLNGQDITTDLGGNTGLEISDDTTKNNQVANSSLRILSPNGGERFIPGDTIEIVWEGVEAEDTVRLEYSVDNGSRWNVISAVATGLSYEWIVPNEISDSCLIRVSSGQIDDVMILGLGTLSQVIYSPDGTRLASCGGGGIFIWDIATEDTILSIRENTGYVYSIAYSPDGSRIVSGSSDKTIKIWDANTGAEIRTLSGHTFGVNSVSYSPDGNRIVSGSGYWDNTIKIWDANTGVEIRTFSGHPVGVSSVSYSPDGGRIVSGSWDNTIKIWDANTGAEIRTLSGHTNDVYSVSYSPDGSRIVSGSRDNTIKIWDSNTVSEIRTLSGHKLNVYSVSYSPDGSKIVSGSGDNTIKIWDSNTGSEIRTLSGHTLFVSSVSYSPDGSQIVSGSGDGTLRIWNLEGSSIISDISDSVWSIQASKKAILEVESLSFGNLICEKETKRTIHIKNTGEAILDVLSIQINDENFELEKPFSLINIPPGGLDSIEVIFKPIQIGPSSATLEIKSNAYNAQDSLTFISLTGRKDSVAFELSETYIELTDSDGKLKENVTFDIMNTGTYPLTWATPIDIGNFHIKSILPNPTPPGQASSALVVLNDYNSDTTYEEIFELSDTCGNSIELLFFARIKESPGQLTIQAGDISAKNGVIVQLPIYIKNPEKLELTDATGIKSYLRFNANILYPQFQTNYNIMEGDTREILLEFPFIPEKDTVLYFPFLAMLGNQDSTILDIYGTTSLNQIQDSINITEIDGMFTLDICRAGGKRLINSNIVYLKQNRPNPAFETTTIEFYIDSSQPFRLSLFNIYGDEIKDIAKGISEKGNNNFSVNVSDLQSGVYIYKLEINEVIMTDKLWIIR